MIFIIESLISSYAIRRIAAATINPDTYSIRPWPNGCSESGFAPASLNPISVTAEDPASDRLLNASAVTAIEWLIVPAKNLPQKSRIFKKIPTIPQRIPYSCLIFPLSSFSLIKNFERNVIMSDPPVSDLIQCLFPNTSI